MACCASFPWALIEKTCFLESITSRRLEIRKTMITTFVWQMIGSSGWAFRLSIRTIFFFVNGPYHPEGQTFCKQDGQQQQFILKMIQTIWMCKEEGTRNTTSIVCKLFGLSIWAPPFSPESQLQFIKSTNIRPSEDRGCGREFIAWAQGASYYWQNHS